nr:immunoglobulin light chain junction region [Macaca mulatta]
DYYCSVYMGNGISFF